jgi:hypothetical protein
MRAAAFVKETHSVKCEFFSVSLLKKELHTT